MQKMYIDPIIEKRILTVSKFKEDLDISALSLQIRVELTQSEKFRLRYREPQWVICKEQYEEWKLVFQKLIESKVPSLNFKNLQEMTRISLFKLMRNIAFINIRVLHLDKCSLRNIELIQAFHCPELQSFLLDNNQICSIKSIRKNHHQKLKTFSIRSNLVRDLQVSSGFIENQCFRRLQFSSSFEDNRKVQIENFNIYAKMKVCDWSFEHLSQQQKKQRITFKKLRQMFNIKTYY